MRWLALFVPLLFFMPYFAPADSNAILLHLKGGEIKTLEFPLGTKIKQIVSDGNIEISKAAGIKNGQRILFLNIFSEGKTDVKIEYELPEKPLFNKDEHDFLIICPDEWITDLQPLAEQKEQYGIKTVIVGLNEIYEGKYFAVNGRDDAEKIKYFIKDAIENWGIKYVMLVGDAEIMPVRYATTGIEDVPEVPSDLYFADIYYSNGSFSSWDLDGDKKYGERKEDKPDLYPDVYIGRLPASNENEVKLLVNKIINYETPPMKALMVGVELFWDTDNREGEYLKEEIGNELNIEVIKLYETDGYAKDGNATPEEIAEYINKGVMLVNFASHGNPGGMGWESGHFYTSDLSLLHNSYLPVVFAMACSTNEFDTTDCLGEEFLLCQNGGAIAYAGSSRVAFVYLGKSIKSGLSGYLDKAFFKAYYDGSITTGEIFAMAKIDYLTRIPFRNDHDVLTLTEYNIMGDPSITLPVMPLTTKAHVSQEVSNTTIKIWAETTEDNVSIDLYYRKKSIFGGRWYLYGSKDEEPYEWEFLPDEDGYYEFYTVMKKGNYTENSPDVADAYCLFDFSSPTINITKPNGGGIYIFNKEVFSLPVNFAVVIGKIDIMADGNARYVEFYVDDELKYTDYDMPYEWQWNEFAIGRHEIKVVAYNALGAKAEEKVNVWAVIL